MLVVATVIQAGAVNGALDTINTDIMWKDEIPISLLSFQAAGQIIGSRALGVTEIPSVVLTSMLCDIASDPNIAAPLKSNVKRNRRALAFTCILVGAIVLVIFSAPSFPFSSCFGGRRPSPPPETCLLTLEPSPKRNTDCEIVQGGVCC